MQKSDCYFFGRITKTHGLRGEVNFHLDVDDPGYYRTLEVVLVSQNQGDDLIPYFITSLDLRQRGHATVSLENVENHDQAQDLVGSELYLPLTALPPLAGNQFYFHEIVGFTVVDAEHGELGPIEEVLEQTAQPVAIISGEDDDFLLPLVDEFIQKVDRKNRRLEVNTPSGLVDLYRS